MTDGPAMRCDKCNASTGKRYELDVMDADDIVVVEGVVLCAPCVRLTLEELPLGAYATVKKVDEG